MKVTYAYEKLRGTFYFIILSGKVNMVKINFLLGIHEVFPRRKWWGRHSHLDFGVSDGHLSVLVSQSLSDLHIWPTLPASK